MDWELAITRNREALLRIVAVLFATVGLVPGGAVATLPRQLRCQVLRLLRPAESAVRRLVVLVARDVTLPPLMPRAFPAGLRSNRGTGVPAFPLLDPLKRFPEKASVSDGGAGPRLAIPGFDDPVFSPASSPDDPVSAEHLCQRMQALQRVLDDLPRQAKRLLRWKERRAKSAIGRLSPIRPGWPPGHRERPLHEVDMILSDCHALVRHVPPPDTS